MFTNDFPALLENVPSPAYSEDPLFQSAPALGTCKVMCFHPKSNVTLPVMTLDEIGAVIDRWIEEYNSLGQKYNWVQIFENKGAIMGCSNPHPHCQIWASSFLPNEPRVKDVNQREYFEKYGRPMLMDYMARELDNKERTVVENDAWVAVVPYWAVWPYEMMILPKRHVQRFTDLNEMDKKLLADMVKRVTTKYDNLFEVSFPYSMGFHGEKICKNLRF